MKTKLVNIYPSTPITDLNPPIRGVVRNVTKTIEEIRTCLMKRAAIEEILPNGKIININIGNYDKDNFNIPVNTIVKKIEDTTEKEVRSEWQSAYEEALADKDLESMSSKQRRNAKAAARQYADKVVEATKQEKSITEYEEIVETINIENV